MTPMEALDKMTNHCGCVSVFSSTEDLVINALDRARVIGVLFTWKPGFNVSFFSGQWHCKLESSVGLPDWFSGATADECCATAARAIENGEV